MRWGHNRWTYFNRHWPIGPPGLLEAAVQKVLQACPFSHQIEHHYEGSAEILALPQLRRRRRPCRCPSREIGIDQWAWVAQIYLFQTYMNIMIIEFVKFQEKQKQNDGLTCA
jgi:hypothetical protein